MSKQVIAVFTADNHLRPNTWTKHPTLQHDAYEALRAVFVHAICEQVPLFILGDLFDKQLPDPLSVQIFFECVNMMQEEALDVYYLGGNHDKVQPYWALLHPHVRHAASGFKVSGVRFYGIDFKPASQIADALGAVPADTQVLLTHQAWVQIQRVGHPEADYAMIPHGLTLLTGDYHIRDKYTGNAHNGDPVIGWSPGSTCMQALNEQPDKAVGLLYDDLSVTWQPIPSRPFMNMLFNDEQTMNEFIQVHSNDPTSLFQNTDQLPSEIQKPILRIRYNDLIPDAYSRLTNAFGESVHLFLEPQRQGVVEVIDELSSPEGAFDSLITALGELVPVDSEVYRGARRLLESADSATELQSMFAEFKTQYAKS